MDRLAAAVRWNGVNGSVLLAAVPCSTYQFHVVHTTEIHLPLACRHRSRDVPIPHNRKTYLSDFLPEKGDEVIGFLPIFSM